MGASEGRSAVQPGDRPADNRARAHVEMSKEMQWAWKRRAARLVAGSRPGHTVRCDLNHSKVRFRPSSSVTWDLQPSSDRASPQSRQLRICSPG